MIQKTKKWIIRPSKPQPIRLKPFFAALKPEYAIITILPVKFNRKRLIPSREISHTML
jgi:hypothetical protein